MADHAVFNERGYLLAFCKLAQHRPSQDHGWLAGNVRGTPCTLARCTHCDAYLASTYMDEGFKEHFDRVVRWYHFGFRRIIRARQTSVGRT